MHPGLTPPHSDYGGIRRPDILMSGGHPLGFGDQNTNLLNIHPSAGLSGIEDGIHQVRISLVFILIFLAEKDHGLEYGGRTLDYRKM